MSPRTSTLFLHELRTALWESRWIAPIPTLIFTLGLSCWYWIPSNDTILPVQEFLRGFIRGPWWLLAWTIPYMLFKKTDLHDPNASWRTMPVAASLVFGSRILLAFIFTVLAPATVVGVTVGFQAPDSAYQQTALSLVYQWISLWIGASVAFTARGHRGLIHLASAIVAFFVGIYIVSLITETGTENLNSDDINYHYMHYGFSSIAIIAAFTIPLTALHTLIRPRHPARWFHLTLTSLILLPAHIGIIYFRPDRIMPDETLPEIKQTSNAINPPYISYSGRYTTGITATISETAITLENNLSEYFTTDNFALGNWNNNSNLETLAAYTGPKKPQLRVHNFGKTTNPTSPGINSTSQKLATIITKCTIQPNQISLKNINWTPSLGASEGSEPEHKSMIQKSELNLKNEISWNKHTNKNWPNCIALNLNIRLPFNNITQNPINTVTTIKSTLLVKKLTSANIIATQPLKPSYFSNKPYISIDNDTRLIIKNHQENPIYNILKPHNNDNHKNTAFAKKTYVAAIINTSLNEGIFLRESGYKITPEFINPRASLECDSNPTPSPEWLKDTKLVIIEVNYGPEVRLPVTLTVNPPLATNH